MSSTHQPKREGQLDAYQTPEWVTQSIIPYLPSGAGLGPDDRFRVLEPCCGNGEILKALAQNGNYNLTGVDVKLPDDKTKEGRAALAGLKRIATIQQKDFLEWYPSGMLFDMVVTNPPYNSAMEFLEHAFDCLQPGGECWLLLRMGFLESRKRRDFIANHVPDVYQLPVRPSFTGGGTDSASYAWMCFHNLHGRTAGVIRVLPLPERVDTKLVLTDTGLHCEPEEVEKPMTEEDVAVVDADMEKMPF